MHVPLDGLQVFELESLSVQEHQAITSKRHPNINDCLLYFQTLETTLADKYFHGFLESRNVSLLIKCINCLDRLCIVKGSSNEVLQRISELETNYADELSIYNKQSRAMDDEDDIQKLCSHDLKSCMPDMLSVERIFRHKEPHVIWSYARHWKAVHKWSFEFFLKIHGHRLVPVEIGTSYTETSWSQTFTQLENVLSIENKDIKYLAQFDLSDLIPSLRHDFDIPDVVEIGLPGYRLSEAIVNFWIGPNGCYTPLHFDPYVNFFVQIRGYKLFYLANPSYFGSGNLFDNNTSKLGLADLEKHVGSRVSNVILGPGDALIIPKGWWHAVKSLTPSISISFWR